MNSKTLIVLLVALTALAASPGAASALELNGRRVEVSGQVDTKAGAKIANDLMKLDEAGSEPIYLLVTATGGSAQGVMLVADAIKALQSPVVAVVLTPVLGAGATLPLFADRVVMLPSAQLVITEVEYEGVAKPPSPSEKPAPPPDGAKPPTKAETFMQKVRADYLQKFWAAVARRLNDKGGAALQADIEAQGGRIITAEEALQKKIAFEVVASIDAPNAPSEKIEQKTTTTRTITKTVPAKKVEETFNGL